jgi:hypothetical protein
MEIIDILRALARRKLALAGILVLSILAGLAVQYRISVSPPGLSERVTTEHAAQIRLLLDAPEEPPTVDLDSGVADTLALRAGLLADLMATDSVRAMIAARAGIAPADLAVVPPSAGPPPLPIPLAIAAADAARLTSEPYALTVAADPLVPIVRFVVGAPDAGAARRVAAAAADSYEQLVAARASRRSRLSVARLGLVRTTSTVDRPHPVMGIAATIVLFALGACALVLGAGLRRQWRAARLRPRPAA